MSLLGDLLDARRRTSKPAPMEEAFRSELHPHRPKGPGGGQFARKVLGVGSRRSSDGPGLAKSRSPRGAGKQASAPGASQRDHVPGPVRGRTDLSGKRVYGQLARPAGGGQTAAKIAEKDLPKAVGTGPWTPKLDATMKALRAGDIPDTENAYRAKLPNGRLGPYSPERIELHARIARALLQGAQVHARPRATFMAGGPASGKSSLIKAGAVKIPDDAVDVNPDIVRTMLPEYAKLIAAGDEAASSKTHEEASHIAKMVMNLALTRKHHVTVDGTGNSGPGKFAGKIRAASENGHEVQVVYATIDTEEAVTRAAARAQRSGRHVPTGYLRATHRDVTQRFLDDVSQMSVQVVVYDTTTRKPKLIWRKQRTTEGQIADRKAYARFVAKATGAVTDA